MMLVGTVILTGSQILFNVFVVALYIFKFNTCSCPTLITIVTNSSSLAKLANFGIFLEYRKHCNFHDVGRDRYHNGKSNIIEMICSIDVPVLVQYMSTAHIRLL